MGYNADPPGCARPHAFALLRGRPGGPRPRVHAKARSREVSMREGQLWATAPIRQAGPVARTRLLGKGDGRGLRDLGQENGYGWRTEQLDCGQWR